MSPRTIRLGGYAHRYYVARPASARHPPVLALHGFGTDARTTFRPIFQPMTTRDVPVYALDLLGFGSSAKPEIIYALEHYADLCVAFADTLALDRPVLMGHSMGGKIAAATAALHPDRFAGLLLVAPGGFSWIAPWLPFLASTRWANALLQNRWFQRTLLPLLPGGRLLARPKSQRQLRRLRHSHYALDLDATGLRSKLSAITHPVHLIWGVDDAILPASTVRRIQRQFPHLTVTRMADAGHLPMHDQPIPFAEATCGFLRAIDRTSAGSK